MNAKKNMAIRVILSLLLGLGVAWMPLNMVRGSWITQFSSEQMATQWSLKSVAYALEDYKKKRGHYPTDIQIVLSAEFDDTDGWKRPWVYSVSNGKPLVESLGRDGKRGGSQQDADLSNLAPRPAIARLSTWQRWMHPVALGLRTVALLLGGIMTTLVFVGLKGQTFELKTLLPLVISLVLAFMLAAFGALIIGIAHVPSGH